MTGKLLIGRLLKLLKPYKRQIVFIFIYLIISAVLNLLIPLLTRNVMDTGLMKREYDVLVNSVLMIFLFYVLDALIKILEEKQRIYMEDNIHEYLEKQAFSHLMKLKISYYETRNYSEILQNTVTDINTISRIANSEVLFSFTQLVSFFGGILGLLIINKQLTCAVLAYIPVKYIIAGFFSKKMQSNTECYIENYGNYARWYGNTLAGIKEVRLFGLERLKEKEFAAVQRAVLENLKQRNWIKIVERNSNIILLQSLISLLYIVGGIKILNLNITVGSLFAFIAYSSYVTEPVSSILNIRYEIAGILPSAKRYFEFLKLDEETEGESVLMGREALSIQFDKVHFGYIEGRQVLNGISFSIPAGNSIAFVGLNGSGKTTMIELLLRLYEPHSGVIRINGQPVNSYTLESYRGMISVVNQSVYLFNDTIKNNICLNGENNPDRLLEVLYKCGLSEFASEEGINKIVGENGVMLSGGQKQKIAFARALIQDRPIMVLDEVTSNLDICAELQIKELIKNEFKRKTIILITHKTELLEDMDQIFLIKEGKLKLLSDKKQVFDSDCRKKLIAELEK